MKKLWELYLSCAYELNAALFGANITFGLALVIFIAVVLLKNNGII